MKFYDFIVHLLQTVWKNIEKERNTGMSKLMHFLWDTRYLLIQTSQRHPLTSKNELIPKGLVLDSKSNIWRQCPL